ncbi:hypothetical protein FACS1894163_03280 [Spirochaetia bacterium]|nr:hypothetical protein FACS1894163_03280 [Spirochaetia bacterium]
MIREIQLRHPEVKKAMIYGSDGVPDAFWYEEGPNAYKVQNYFESPPAEIGRMVYTVRELIDRYHG